MWLFCENFPYGYDELTFIPPELYALRKRFNVTIITTNLSDPKSIQLPGDVRVIRNDTHKGKISGRIKALFSPVFWREISEIMRNSQNGNILRKINWALSWFSIGIGSAGTLNNLPEPDIIYSFWRRPYLLGVLLKRRKLGNPPIICRAHGKDLFLERAPLKYHPFAAQTDRLIDGVYLVSQAGYEYYMNHFSTSKNNSKVHIARLGCLGFGGYKDSFSPEFLRRNELRIFSCSHLVPLKRVDKIIDAVSIIANELPDRKIVWVHAGGGSEENALRRQAAKLPCNTQWEIMGAVPNEMIQKRLAEGWHCFVTASESEGGVPVSVAEAFSCGIPAMGTAVGGIPEIIHSGTGILLSENPSSSDIAAALLEISELSDEEYIKMRRSAYGLWQSEFDAEKNAEKFAVELLRLVEKTPPGISCQPPPGHSHSVPLLEGGCRIATGGSIKKILIISQLYAPAPAMGAVRWTKLAKYLARAGMDVEVIAAASHNPESESHKRDTAGISKIHRIGNIQPEASGGNHPGGFASTPQKEGNFKEGNIKKKIKNLPPALYLRRAMTWHKDYKRGRDFAGAAAEYMDKNIDIPSYDAVAATFGPVGNILLAKHIKQKWPGIRLLVDFRDPMTNDLQPPLIRHIYAKLQREICGMADYLTAVTKSFCECIFECPPARPFNKNSQFTIHNSQLRKWHLVSNGYDPEDFPDHDELKDDNPLPKFSFAYTGELYEGKRDLSPVFRIIRRLIDEGRLDQNDVEFHYAGNNGSAMNVQAGKYGLRHRIIDHGRVSKDESIALQRKSRFLLLSNWFIGGQTPLSGKLYEYMAAGQPIVATVSGKHTGSELRRIIEKGRLGITHEQADPDSDRILYDYLSCEAERFKQRLGTEFCPDREYVESYAHPKLAWEILGILQNK